MLKNVSCEQVGISTEHVYTFLNSLVKHRFPLHSVLLMRGTDIFLEAYWKPFHKDFQHRMYSVTKSFVSVAVGLAVEDGLIDLDKPMIDYFPEKIDSCVCPELQAQTVRQMLTMTTAGFPKSWFASGDPDRTHYYFHERGNCRPAGTVWQYDSHGSQVLCALVEKVTGKTLLNYLQERIFCHLDAFSGARILQTPNGDSWGDSALICTPRDLAVFAQFVGNYGQWEGKQLMDADYLKTATSAQVSNTPASLFSMFNHGYGYQFWCSEKGGIVFKGMGGQMAICIPSQNLVMACTADLQGDAWVRDYIMAQFIDCISDHLADKPLPPNPEAEQKLHALTESLELYALSGAQDSPMRQRISGVTYFCNENPLGWKQFSIRFENEQEGVLSYEKKNGTLEIPFYVNRNCFGKFPELGYSRERGGVRTTDGHTYRDAVSATWIQPDKLLIYVQAIDDYFGNILMDITFRDDMAFVNSKKNAEDFFWDYTGQILAHRQ